MFAPKVKWVMVYVVQIARALDRIANALERLEKKADG